MPRKNSPVRRNNAAAPLPLSVVMPVHNALPHLDEAVESILRQTFHEFEFVILDDASTDGSSDRLRHWAAADSRIRLLHAQENLGPVGSSNMVASAAAAPLVARMDADDISYPERLMEQLQLLNEHEEVGVLGTLCDMIDSSGRKLRGPEFWRLSRRSPFVPFAHGSMMYRREVFEKIGGYREECAYWEDQDLVVRMSTISKVAVIPRALYRVRQSTTSTRVMSDQGQLERALDGVFRATDRLQQGLEYDSIVSRSHGGSEKLDPRVFIALGSLRLWAGTEPRLFRRLLSRAKISWDSRWPAALIWTAWASASPRSLRAFLMLLLNARNRYASASLSRERPLIWYPSKAALPIGEAEASS